MSVEENLRYTDDDILDYDFVAIGNDEDFDHAVFIIQYKDNIYEFDFYNSSRGMTIINLTYEYYYKITKIIQPDVVPAFYAFCKNVMKKAKPKFGYFYSGESYNEKGEHMSETDLGERMTCVGFCLNILKGFLGEDYLSYEDWDEFSHYDPEYLESFCKKNGFEIEEVTSHHRRITPIDCLTSCFFSDMPISKKDIDRKRREVENYVHSQKPTSTTDKK